FNSTWRFFGSGGAAPVSYQAVLDGMPFCNGTVSVTPLPGGVTTTTSCPTAWVATGGSHTVQWDLDYTSIIPEVDESNNSVARTFTPLSTQGTQPATYFVYDD